MLKVGFVKIGNLGISQMVDLILDERAEREILTRTISTGAKTTSDEALEAMKAISDFAPDLFVVVTPTTSLLTSGMIKKVLHKPCIIISDAPAKKAVEAFKKDGFGYIILLGDPLIGARREFLDPTEMALFNSDTLRVLTICGAVRLIQEELDKVIGQIQDGKRAKLPQIIADASVVERAGFSNPYAKAKALAAYQMAEKVAEIDTRACFILQDVVEYTITAASAHELMRFAALLADEAREIEKYGDTISRKPHDDSGAILSKRRLLDKPRKGGD